jgi:two-component system LytT family response regulator
VTAVRPAGAPRRQRALIVDDEPVARAELRSLLRGVGWLSCVGEAATCDEAIGAIDRLRPDVVFLDVQMPGGTGLDVLDRVRHRPLVVFTTAYDRYAVEAFDRAATDYLVKPFGDRRFGKTAERVRAALAMRAGPSGPAGRRSIFVADRGALVNVPVDDIVALSADDDYVRIRTATRAYLEHGRLGAWAAKLDPASFLRVHRSHVVNRDWVVQTRAAGNGRVELRLRDGTSIVASRRAWRQVRSAFR